MKASEETLSVKSYDFSSVEKRKLLTNVNTVWLTLLYIAKKQRKHHLKLLPLPTPPSLQCPILPSTWLYEVPAEETAAAEMKFRRRLSAEAINLEGSTAKPRLCWRIPAISCSIRREGCCGKYLPALRLPKRSSLQLKSCGSAEIPGQSTAAARRLLEAARKLMAKLGTVAKKYTSPVEETYTLKWPYWYENIMQRREND